MQYSFNNSRKIPKLAQFIPGIYNNFYYKIIGYFWGVTQVLLEHLIHSLSLTVGLRVISSRELALRTPYLEQLNLKSACEPCISIAHYVLRHPKMLHNIAEEDACCFFSWTLTRGWYEDNVLRELVYHYPN